MAGLDRQEARHLTPPQLAPALERLKLRSGLLRRVAGVNERRNWAEGETVDSATVRAGQRALAAGARLFWDNTNRRLTTAATGNHQVGIAVQAALAADATVRAVLLRVPPSGS